MAANPPRKDSATKNFYHHPAANTAATKTITGGTNQVMVVDQIDISFDITLATKETLTIESPAATTIWKVDLPAAAAATPFPPVLQLFWPRGLNGALGEDIVITLTATAGGEIGKLNVLYH